MNVQVVAPEYVYQLWDQVRNFIQSSITAAGNELTIDQVKLYLVSGQWQLIIFIDEAEVVHGAAVVRYENRPNERVAFVTAMGGKGIIEDDGRYKQFMTILKGHGATMMEGACRPSAAALFVRKWRATEKCIIVEVEL